MWSCTSPHHVCLHSMDRDFTVMFITYDNLLSYLLSYLLTPGCRVLLEQLSGLQLVKKFPAFHGTRRFITALTIVSHLSLSWASPIQSIYPHPSSWRSILILSTHLRLGIPSVLFPSDFVYDNTTKMNNIIIYIFKVKSVKLQLLLVSTNFGSSSGSTYQLHVYEK